MDVTERQIEKKKSEKKHKMALKKRQYDKKKVISLSASLPDDVCGVFAGSTCVVKCSSDPVFDIRESILEMIKDVGNCGWSDIEELVYCYLALNSPDLHPLIVDVFLSLLC